MKLLKNMGTADKVLRVLASILLVTLYFTRYAGTATGYVLLVIGIVFLLTSFAGFCPLYVPFGWNTRNKN